MEQAETGLVLFLKSKRDSVCSHPCIPSYQTMTSLPITALSLSLERPFHQLILVMISKELIYKASLHPAGVSEKSTRYNNSLEDG